MYQIELSPAVAAELGPDQAALARAGELAPAEYECLICRRAGDMRRQPAAAVLFTDAASMVLSWYTPHAGPAPCTRWPS